MTDDWPELDGAKRGKDEEVERAWRELEAQIFAEEMEEKAGRMFRQQELRERAAPHLDAALLPHARRPCPPALGRNKRKLPSHIAARGELVKGVKDSC